MPLRHAETEEEEYTHDRIIQQVRGKIQHLRTKYPSRVPTLVFRACATIPDLERHKYLVPCSITLGQFVYVIRQRLGLGSYECLHITTRDNTLPSLHLIMTQVHKTHAEKEGFLILYYHREKVFG